LSKVDGNTWHKQPFVLWAYSAFFHVEIIFFCSVFVVSLNSQADLIHLGAKYSPCMRVDENVMREIKQDRDTESRTACCIRNDGSGCVQTLRSQCPVSFIYHPFVIFVIMLL
jgi:hypothetical protein